MITAEDKKFLDAGGISTLWKAIKTAIKNATSARSISASGSTLTVTNSDNTSITITVDGANSAKTLSEAVTWGVLAKK